MTLESCEMAIALREMTIKLCEMTIALCEMTNKLCEMTVELCEMTIALSEMTIESCEMTIGLTCECVGRFRRRVRARRLADILRSQLYSHFTKMGQRNCRQAVPPLKGARCSHFKNI